MMFLSRMPTGGPPRSTLAPCPVCFLYELRCRIGRAGPNALALHNILSRHRVPPCRDSSRAYQHALMTIAWHAALLRDALVFDRGLEHHAFGELVDEIALDFLPGRLAVGISIAAALLQRRAPLCELRGRDQDIGSALVQIDAHAVAGLKECQPAAGGGFRCRVENRRRARRARLATV